jgi:hypothetical protein
MPYPTKEEVLLAVRRLNSGPSNRRLRTNGLWHVLIFLRHRRLNGLQDAYTLSSFDLTEACFDLNGIRLPVSGSDQYIYYEPAASSGTESDYFHQANAPRNTYLERIQRSLSGRGQRQPDFFETDGTSLPVTVSLRSNWITAVRDGQNSRDNRVLLDERTYDLLTWVFRFGIPNIAANPTSLARHVASGRLERRITLELDEVPTSDTGLRDLVEDYFGIDPTERTALLPRL